MKNDYNNPSIYITENGIEKNLFFSFRMKKKEKLLFVTLFINQMIHVQDSLIMMILVLVNYFVTVRELFTIWDISIFFLKQWGK